MTTAARPARGQKCLGCPKRLTNPVSRLRGRGPDCWRKWREANGWAAGERRVRVRAPKRPDDDEVQPVLYGLADATEALYEQDTTDTRPTEGD